MLREPTMKKSFLTTLLLALSVVPVCAQDSLYYEQTFDWVVRTFEANDAGFPPVVKRKGRKDYERFTEQQRQGARNANNDNKFIQAVEDWLYYFRRGHISIRMHKVSVTNDKPNKNDLDSESPDTQVILNHIMQETPDNLKPYLEKMSDRTLYLRLRTFYPAVKPYIDKLLAENDSLIRSTPNLIIDIRDNQGGNDGSFSSIIPYLYTNPIRMLGNRVRVSEQNIATMEKYAGMFDSNYLLALASKMKSCTEDYINDPDQPVTLWTFPEVLPYPRRVGILCNELPASSAEAFLLVAKQSRKVKVFGRHTGGSIDVSNMAWIDSPDGRITLGYCMTISLRVPYFPIDGIGVQPDYYIDPSIPYKDWEKFTQEILDHE